MKALIVDDVEMNREILAMFLEGRADVVCAESGEDSLKLVEEALGSDAYFDLICMDISMPGMDGHEALKRIREMEAKRGGARSVVFMVTASSSTEDMLDALLQGGCDDYLVKPLMKQNFLALLAKYGLMY